MKNKEQLPEIPMKDRSEEAHLLQILFGSLGIHLDAMTVDLMQRGLKVYEELGKDRMGIWESSKVKVEWEKHWTEYFEGEKEIKQ